MKVIFHPKFYTVYTSDPAAEAGRMESIMRELKDYEVVEADYAKEDEILLVHTKRHLEYVRSEGIVYEMALLSAGGAIKAAKIAFSGEPVFAAIRPPGHHASSDSCWGFCYFNNVAVALRSLQKDKKIKKAVIVDFDLHFGDGSANIFANDKDVRYYHMPGSNIDGIVDFLRREDYEIIAVSAGFDKHVEDWGGLLYTEDYEEIGKIVKEFAEERCEGRRFAVLEGGYNHEVLGKNVKAFVEGFK